MLWCDNQSSIALAHNPVFHSRSNQIEIDVHFIQEKIASKCLAIQHVPSIDQIANIFTKSLLGPWFTILLSKLTIHSLCQLVEGC